ncbi:proline/glycine betaine ABC transporter permease [Lysinibacillus sp. CNPSo 3705]|uniref:ABC transporter permease n=1 Tax=Lysinibacillus sp. CNPSo 3705 TaxID=3028148 RepID=UPI00104EE449|nr:proline/glycine betaine ABC transporter permease [Lysinibacillus sp. CNPSo 3705]MDD1501951.1 proline/glycine betaine ABC transporter permease [Lysinibacillus sp. CNPSo 3705]
MNNLLDNIPAIPVGPWVESVMDWLTSNFSMFFNLIQKNGKLLMNQVTDLLVSIPPIILILLIVIFAFFVTGKKFGLATFSLIGLLFIYNQGLWTHLMETTTLVLFSSIISIILGIPLGILMSKSTVAENVIKPILDFMQTMPGFVYLIPAVAFFGIGIVPGVFASVIFALPPTVRMTNLGIRQVPKELVEAADSYGSTSKQKLFKVEIPLAKSTIMAGINQTVMLSLSMVVTASMIGAPGLGREVLTALQRTQVGNGFVAGLGLVIFAIVIDRLTQSFNKKKAV